MFKKITRKYLIISFFIFSLFLSPLITLAAGTPSHLSYQGKLTDTGGNPLGGGGTTYYFKFSLWDAESGGTKVWPTSSPNSVPLTVKQGSFNVRIGDTSNGYPDTLDYDFNSNNPVYLQIEVSGDDATYETLTPRSQLSSAAFSQIASRVSGTADSSFGTTTSFADTLVSMLSTAVNKAVLTIKGAAGQVANLFNILDSNNNTLFTVTAGGNVGIGTSTPTSKLSLGSGQIEVPVGSASLPSYSFSGDLDTGVYSSGANSVQIVTGGVIKASFAASGILSIDGNTQVRIPSGLETNPGLSFGVSAPGTGIYRPGGASLAISTNSVSRMFFDGVTGNIGIGTSTPGALLSIASTTTGYINLNQSSGTSYNQIVGPASATAGNTLLLVQSNGSMGGGGSIFRAVTSGNVGIRVTENGAFYGPSSASFASGGGATLSLGGVNNTNTFTTSNNGSHSATDFLFKAGTADRTAGNLFQVANYTSPVFTVTSVSGGGNIGIGTTTPSQQLSITGNFQLPASTATAGIIYSGNDRYIHTFGSVTNFFAGIQSGNLTMTGTENSGIGYQTLDAVTSGSGNMAFGSLALSGLQSGSYNIAVGRQSLWQLTTGSQNTAIGRNSLYNLTGAAGSNVAIGDQTLFDALNGVANTAVGTQALENNIPASNSQGYNTGIGYVAGGAITTGQRNIFIGALAGYTGTLATGNDMIAIGYNVHTTASNQINIGNTIYGNTSTGNVGIGTSTPSQKLSVVGSAQFTAVGSGAHAFDLNLTSDGTLTTSASDIRLKENITQLDSRETLEKILQLKPATFDWKSNSAHDIGLIAQEVEEIFPELVFTNSVDGYKGINYSRIPALLISAIQELVNKIDNFAKEFRTEKLCVGDTCITENELKEILENKNIQSGAPIQEIDIEDNDSSEDSGDGATSTDTDNLPEDIVNSSNTSGSGDTVPSLIEEVSTPEPTSAESDVQNETTTETSVDSSESQTSSDDTDASSSDSTE